MGPSWSTARCAPIQLRLDKLDGSLSRSRAAEEANRALQASQRREANQNRHFRSWHALLTQLKLVLTFRQIRRGRQPLVANAASLAGQVQARLTTMLTTTMAMTRVGAKRDAKKKEQKERPLLEARRQEARNPQGALTMMRMQRTPSASQVEAQLVVQLLVQLGVRLVVRLVVQLASLVGPPVVPWQTELPGVCTARRGKVRRPLLCRPP